ncbi:acyl carrier protein [Nocardioides mesophilus]|uniref:Acyl carrier protein n=1 Tax=Nocardioides mesophilus TaxID=433659 RepID=A0A7G9RD07_9ACTN|nr:acyl carrier protein [Nocardioides mesophilus]QNN53482.1 acyl carrier protein [Nocardioides mesophilus]
MTLTTDQARDLVAGAVRRIVPDAEVETLPADEDLTWAFELDSLDFLGFVEALCEDAGVRLDEEDYPALRTMGTATALLQERLA